MFVSSPESSIYNSFMLEQIRISKIFFLNVSETLLKYEIFLNFTLLFFLSLFLTFSISKTILILGTQLNLDNNFHT